MESTLNERSIGSFVEEATWIYGLNANTDRQLPNIVDGLKPVYRRVLYAAYLLKGMTKTATIVGSCFDGDTEILDVNQRKCKIKYLPEVLRSNFVYTYSISPEGRIEVSRILRCWKTGVRNDLVRITLDNGESFVCTRDHKILRRDGSYEQAGDLREGDSLMPLYINYDYRGHRRQVLDVKSGAWIPAYQLAARHPDSKDYSEDAQVKQIHHLDFDDSNDYPINLVTISRAEHLAIHREHRDYTNLHEASRLNTIERWKNSEYRAYMASHIYEGQHKLFRKSAEGIIRLMRVNGLEINLSNWYSIRLEYHKILKGSGTCPSNLLKYFTLDELQNFGFNKSEFECDIPYELWDNTRHGVIGRFTQVAGTMIKLRNLGISEVTPSIWEENKSQNTEYFTEQFVSNFIDLFHYYGLEPLIGYRYETGFIGKHTGRVSQLINHTVRTLVSIRESGKSFSEVPQEFDKYLIKNGIGYSRAVEKFPKLFTEETFYNLGTYHRYNHSVISIEYLDEERDVYDLEVDSEYHNFPLAYGIFAHNCMAAYHPHGDASIAPVVSAMVRYGILKGKGGHGAKTLMGEYIEPAAMRYSEAGISSKYQSMLQKLLPYVPFQPTDLNSTEPTYIPTPVPLCLLFGLLGIGHGAATRIPAFTAKSMYNALKNDDPYLLEAPYGLDIDFEKSDIESLWTTGIGKVCYNFKVSYGHSDDGPGVYISGEAEMFGPRLNELQKLVNAEKIYMREEDDKLFIGRNYNIKSVNVDQIYQLAKAGSSNCKTYRLNVTDGKQIFVIPLRNWLQECQDNYIKLIEKYKTENLVKEKFNLTVYQNLSQVGRAILDNPEMTEKELADKFNLSIDVINTIMSKSIKTLRKGDQSTRINQIENSIKEYENLNIDKWVEDAVNEF